MNKIYVIAKYAYDHEMVEHMELLRAFPDKEEAEGYKKRVNLPWKLKIFEVDFEDYV